LHYESGEILIEGYNIYETDPEVLRTEVKTKIVSYVPQASLESLNPVMKIIDFISDVVKERTGKKEKREALIKFAGDHFERVGLNRDVLFKYPHELSGGMKQRSVIAISTMWNPKLLIVDEPTSALDVSSQKLIIKMLYEMRRDGIIDSILFVSHDVSSLSQICNKMLIMYAGHMQEYGDMDEMVDNPLHPYTELLMNSIVSFDPTGSHDGRLESISGSPPSLKNPPPGCRFSPRCPKVMDKCLIEEPPIIELTTPKRKVKCWLYEEEKK
jgi:peptide/nickel transport system ATP-binding protein